MTTTLLFDKTKFSTETSECPIFSFTFEEVTTAPYQGLSVTCSTPDLNDPCRTITIPTSNERLIGGPIPEFRFRF